MNKRTHPSPHALIGGGADSPDILHATGFSAPDPFLCILDRGKAHLLVSILEYGRAQALGGSVRAHTTEEFEFPDEKRGLGDQLLAYLRSRSATSVRVSPRCPVQIVRTVEAGGIQVDIQPDPQRPGRIKKTPQEIDLLKAAQRAAVSGIRAARQMIGEAQVDTRGGLRTADGRKLTSERVRAHIAHTLMDAGCTAEEIIVAGGDQAVDPHERGHGPLRSGEWIILDVFPRSESGYWGDITRTVMKGNPTPEQQKLFTTVLRAQKEALRQIRPGVRGDRIHGTIAAAFEAAGFATGKRDGIPQGFIHSTGHGVGVEIHEAPRIAPGAGPLRAGMVVTVEPGLYYRGLGGVRIEDTVVVTRDGCELLARCRKDGRL